MFAPLIFFALFGLALGSFVSVLAHRIPIGESPVGGRSRCPGCGIQIAARDNVPVLSWFWLRGRCRSCGERIGIRYPLTELALAAGFAGAYLRFEDNLALIVLGCAFVMTLLTITLIDLEHRIIPNRVLATSAAFAILLLAGTDLDAMPERLIAAGAAFSILFLVALLYPSGMGMGDVKLVAVMGLYLGRAIAPALLIGFAAGAIYGLALIIKHGPQARKQAVPFGPFLAFGGLVGLFAGDEIVDWYLDSFTGT